MVHSNYEAEAVGIIEDRLERLRRLTWAQVRGLPEADGEKVVIAGVKASVTVFRQDGPYELEGRTLVVVLVARKRWFGTVEHHIERGLVFSSDGTSRDATDRELQNSGG